MDIKSGYSPEKKLSNMNGDSPTNGRKAKKLGTFGEERSLQWATLPLLQ